jgi:hypothetical protein
MARAIDLGRIAVDALRVGEIARRRVEPDRLRVEALPAILNTLNSDIGP